MTRTGHVTRGILVRLLSLFLSVAAVAGAPALATEPHRLVLQISDDDPAKMRSVLDISANVSRHYAAQGAEVEIVVVAFAGGLDMLLADRSPVRDLYMLEQHEYLKVAIHPVGGHMGFVDIFPYRRWLPHAVLEELRAP